ncbi:MAG: ABC transporter permease [Kiritimatiellaeota bacterium]|nr:ABC transporter permease [Kiritimatiellota bacterium]
MHLKTDMFLAWRYLKPKRNAVSVITCISVIGVILGVAVLIVVIAVMAGFTDEFKKKLLETSAHIQIYDYNRGYIEDPDAVIATAKSCGIKAAPVVKRHILLQRGRRFVPKLLIGIDPEQQLESVNVSKFVKYGNFSLRKGEILISDVIASEISARVGDTVILHSPAKLAEMVDLIDGKGGKKIKSPEKIYLPSEFKITGIFSFGKYDFDKNVLFTSLDDADELLGLPWGTATVVYARVADPFHMRDDLKKLRANLPGLFVLSWRQMNRKFLGVLEVEKNMQFFLLAFIVLVAAFSITNTLITVVVQKTREIGLLKALGATNGTVVRIFVLQGFIVGLVGTIFGIIAGLAVIHWRNQLLHAMRVITRQEIFPKEFYIFSQLPATVEWRDLLVIGVISVALCTIGGVIPAVRASRLAPAQALRYE